MKNKKIGLLLVLIIFLTGFNFNPKLDAQKLLILLNQDRRSHNLPFLALNPSLTLAAMAKAEDMVSGNYFSHESPNGKKPWDFLTSLGYQYAYAGENLAVGFSDAKDLESSWMNSASHRANILSPFYSEVGLAVVSDKGTNLVVQFFGTRQSKVTFK